MEVEKEQNEDQVRSTTFETEACDEPSSLSTTIDVENDPLKPDSEDNLIVYRFSRRDNHKIYYGKLKTFWRDKEGKPRIIIGPDCRLSIIQGGSLSFCSSSLTFSSGVFC